MSVHTYSIEEIRTAFPILQQEVYKKPLVYLDNGATTQKPQCVIDEIVKYYSQYNSNVHRGVHYLSQVATDALEEARRTVQQFINAKQEQEIVFTKGTTDGINLVAHSFAKQNLKPGDEVLVSEMEHHSNLVPWQMVCEQYGANLKYIPIDEAGNLILDNIDKLINEKTKIVSLTWISNVLGTINPIETIIQKAHQFNIPVCIDAAQAIQHLKVDVQALDIDFLVFSGHKIYGPTGIGVLYGKYSLLENLPPYQGGGSMITQVAFKGTSYQVPPFRFEAGTPHIEGSIVLKAALDYVSKIGIDNIANWEHELLYYAENKLQEIDHLRIIGNAPNKSATISFLIGNIHPFDVGEILDKQGIAVRTGHHCCQPLMEHYKIPGTVRASLALYNNYEDIDRLVEGIHKAVKILG